MLKSLFVFVLSSFFLISCQSKAPQVLEKPLVVTSIPPYVSLVQAIVGDTMSVTSALGNSFDPHTVEVTPRQMKNVRSASLFIGVGEGYEDKMVQAIHQQTKNLAVLKLDKEVPLLSFSQDSRSTTTCCGGHSHAKDLHIWLGLQILIPQVNAMVEALSDLSPDHADQYRKNGAILIKKIQKIDQKLYEELRPFQEKALIVSHPALGYFCHEYDMVQIAVENEGKEPLAKDAKDIRLLAENLDVVCAFTAPQFNNKGVLRIAQKLNLRVESFDPLAPDPLETVQKIAKAITKHDG